MNINQLKKLDLNNDEDLKSFISYIFYQSNGNGPASISNLIVELCYDDQSKEKTFISYLLTIGSLVYSIGSDNFYVKWEKGKFAKALIKGLIILAKSLVNETFEFYNHMNSHVRSILSSNVFNDLVLTQIYAWSYFIEKEMENKGILFNSFDSLLEKENKKLKTKVEIYKNFIESMLED